LFLYESLPHLSCFSATPIIYRDLNIKNSDILHQLAASFHIPIPNLSSYHPAQVNILKDTKLEQLCQQHVHSIELGFSDWMDRNQDAHWSPSQFTGFGKQCFILDILVACTSLQNLTSNMTPFQPLTTLLHSNQLHSLQFFEGPLDYLDDSVTNIIQAHQFVLTPVKVSSTFLPQITSLNLTFKL
jgi:hypothetical protein